MLDIRLRGVDPALRGEVVRAVMLAETSYLSESDHQRAAFTCRLLQYDMSDPRCITHVS